MKNNIILDPLVQKFIDLLKGGRPIYTLTPADARKVLETIQAAPVDIVAADSKDLSIPGGPRGKVDIRIYRPQGNDEKLPVVIWMHGGGWVLGSKSTHDRLMREITNGAQVAVVFVDYTRAPEGQYPTAHEEGYAVAQWIARNGESLALDTSRMALAGDSVGGGMATALALMSKDRKGPKFSLQVLLYPVTDANFETDSYQQFATGYYLERDGMKWFWDSYAPDENIRKQPYLSPLQASLDELKGLPPALVIVNEIDVLRDEGEAYAHKLMQAGVPVAAIRLLGITHDSALLNPLTEAPGVRAEIKIVADSLKRALREE